MWFRMRIQWRALVAEFFGTCVLVFIAACSMIENPPNGKSVLPTAVAQGAAYATLLLVMGRFSGGHFNPVVTWGAFWTRKMELFTALSYIATQLIAAGLSGLLVFATVDPGMKAKNLYPNDMNVGAAIFMETLLTFILVLVVFGVLFHRDVPLTFVTESTVASTGGSIGNITPLVVGLIFSANIVAGYTISGASMNPASALGLAVISGQWSNYYVYWVGPLIGSSFASAVYEFLFMTATAAVLPNYDEIPHYDV